MKKLLDKFRTAFQRLVLPIYWAFLTYMLLRPGSENKEYWFMFPGIDKLLHLSIFGFLGFCIMLSFKHLKFHYYILIIIIYGLGTEILQQLMYLGRSFELLDLLADVTGALFGLLVYKLLLKYFQ